MLIFDIETGPLPEAEVYAQAEVFPPFVAPAPFDPATVKTGNLKDPFKIQIKQDEASAEYEREAAQALPKWEAERDAYYQGLLRDAALSPLTGRVLCIGYWTPRERFMLDAVSSEAQLLEAFWATWLEHQHRKAIGFNIYHFDLPFLVKRSWVHGIRPPRTVRGVYWHESFVDLMQVYAMGDKRHISLDRLSRFLLGRGKDRTGDQFWNLWESNRDEAVKYVESDLNLTLDLAERMGVIQRWD